MIQEIRATTSLPRDRCDVTLYSFTKRTSRAILMTRLDFAPITPAFPAFVP